MYSIGEFSKVNRITPKTLRHYDKIGLLKPSRIDNMTGYRYYSSEKLSEISKIIMLKEMGFSLHEIKEILIKEGRTETFLKQKAEQLKSVIKEDEKRLSKVLGYLSEFKGEEKMEANINIKSLPKVIAASMRTIVPGYDTYFDIVPKMGEYMESVGAVCRKPAYCFTIYHDGEYKDSDIEVEICEAVNEVCQESDKVKFKTFEAIPKSACLRHKGPYDTIGESYNSLFAWIDNNGYKAKGNPRESYIDGIWNKASSDLWLTEIQIPVETNP